MTSPKSRDRKVLRARRFRPTVEGLEERAVPAVTWEIGEFDNQAQINPVANDLRIRGGKENTTVFIFEDPTISDTLLFIDNESDGLADTVISLTAAGFSYAEGHINIDLGNGNDFVFYGITGADFAGAHRFLTVNLSAGDDVFLFDADGDPAAAGDPNAILAGASLALEIIGGPGRDQVDLTFGDIESYLAVSTDLGGGSDTFDFLCGDTGNGGATYLTVDTGEAGNDVNIGFGDIGSDDLWSSFVIDVAGGDEADRVTLAVNGAVAFGSTLDVTTHLGGDDDVFLAEIDLSTFAILQNSLARFNLHAGKGSDHVRIIESTDSTAVIEGVFSVNIFGGKGHDTVMVDFEGTADFSLTAAGRFFMRIDAGAGNDQVFVVSSNLPSNTGTYDIILKMGVGNDLMNFQLVTAAAGVSFGPINRILIDGGPGKKDRFVQQGQFAFVVDAFFELAGLG